LSVELDADAAAGEIARRDAISVLSAAIPELYRYAARLTGGDRWLTEDLVQEACLAFVRQRQAGSSDEITMGWLIVVVRRRYLDHLRRSHREDRRARRAHERDVAVEDADWKAVDGSDALTMLGELPAHQRAALVLRYIDDLPVQEVATLMGRSLAATESLLARGRRQLAHRVNGGDDG
jgi:RNA polymerase sigma-70 factor (ECF subfamily)